MPHTAHRSLPFSDWPSQAEPADQPVIIAKARSRDEGIMGTAASVIMPATMIAEWRRRATRRGIRDHAPTMITESRRHGRRGRGGAPSATRSRPCCHPDRRPAPARTRPDSRAVDGAARNLQCNFH